MYSLQLPQRGDSNDYPHHNIHEELTKTITNTPHYLVFSTVSQQPDVIPDSCHGNGVIVSYPIILYYSPAFKQSCFQQPVLVFQYYIRQ